MDIHPDKIEFEIDREGFLRSLRVTFLIGWAVLFAFLMLFGGLAAMGRVKNVNVSSGLKFLAYWTTGVATFSCAGYFAFTRRTLNRCVNSVSLKVDGPYLLVHYYEAATRSWHDRKFHFKSIVDYGIIESSNMRRHGIQALNLTTVAGGRSSDVVIPAVKDCEKVRDLLTEIDQARENS